MKVTAALLTWLALSACSAGCAPEARSDGDVEVPIGRLSSDEARARGRALFQSRCALCHGEHADGHGVRSRGLSAKPANFRSPDWRSRVTPTYVFRIVSEGKRGTSMPAWPTLSDDQKWDVIAYVLSVSEEEQ